MEEKLDKILFEHGLQFHSNSGYPCVCGCRNEILALFKQQLLTIKEELNKYKCDFNWDFEKNEEKHKSYIALSDVDKILEKATKL